MTSASVTAKVQPRIYSARKSSIEDQIPLDAPFSVHIDVSSVCNFKCSFCFQADSEAMKEVGLRRGKMSLELFKKIIDDLAEFSGPIKKIKIGNHGEPTLHRELPAMIRYARDANVADVIELFTNGSRLTQDLNRSLVASGLQRINISIEGLTSARYLEVTGVQQNVESLVAGVRHLHSIRGNDLIIYVKIADQTRPLDEESTDSFVLDSEERSLFFSTYGDICDEIFIEKIVPQWAEVQVNKQNELAATGMYDQKIQRQKDVCPFTFMYLHFNCDGSASPCTLDWPRKVLVGNVRTQSVHEIWNGNRLRDLRIAMLQGSRNQIGFCKNCSAPMVCVDENLDAHKAKVLRALGADNESTVPNQWIQKKSPQLVKLSVGPRPSSSTTTV